MRDAEDQARDAFARVLRYTGDAAALHAAAIDVIPDSGRDFDAAFVRRANHSLKAAVLRACGSLVTPTSETPGHSFISKK